MKKEICFTTKLTSKTKQVFIGDICYALDENIYDNIWGKEQNYADGVIQDDKNAYGVAVGTEFGDGVYYGVGKVKGKKVEAIFPVDAGVIGVVNMDFLRDDECVSDGKVIYLPCEEVFVEVSKEKGVIGIVLATDEKLKDVFCSISIDTSIF